MGRHDVADECEPHAATAGSRGRLRRGAERERVGEGRIEPRPAVAHLDRDIGSSAREGHAHPARIGAGGGGIHCVVHEVADHRHRLGRGQRQRGSGFLHVEVEGDTVLGGLVELPEQQSDDDGAVVARDDAVGEILTVLRGCRDELPRVVDTSELQQCQQGVQPVAVLVRLRAEGVGERPHPLELAEQGLELGPVPKGHDPAAFRRAPTGEVAGLLLVHQQHAVAGGHGLLDHAAPGGDRLGEGGIHVRLTRVQTRLPLRRRREAEEVGGFVVVQHDAAVAVGDDQALAQRVQHRLVALHESGELARGVRAGDATGAPADVQGPQDADAHDAGRGGDDQGHTGGQIRLNGPQGDPDRDEAHDLAVVGTAGADGRDGSHGRAERALVDLGVGRPGERLFARADIGLADLRGIGVGQPDAVGRHDRDERQVGIGEDRRDHRLQRRRVLCAHERGDVRFVREGLGDRARDLLRLALSGVRQLHGHERREHARDQHDDAERHHRQSSAHAQSHAVPSPVRSGLP